MTSFAFYYLSLRPTLFLTFMDTLPKQQLLIMSVYGIFIDQRNNCKKVTGFIVDG